MPIDEPLPIVRRGSLKWLQMEMIACSVKNFSLRYRHAIFVEGVVDVQLHGSDIKYTEKPRYYRANGLSELVLQSV
jgi:hypothetical protein